MNGYWVFRLISGRISTDGNHGLTTNCFRVCRLCLRKHGRKKRWLMPISGNGGNSTSYGSIISESNIMGMICKNIYSFD